MIYIFDGYNVLFSSSFREWVDKFGLHSARQHLINYIRSKYKNALIVFDGRRDYPNLNIPNVIFTKNESADEFIKNYVKKHAEKQITVVTNDMPLYSYLKNMGVRVLRVSEALKRTKDNSKSYKVKELTDEEKRKINEELKKLWGLL